MLHLSSLGGNRRRDDYLASGKNLKFGNDFCFQRTLIGNRERTNLFEFVAEEFKTHRMFGGGWENVEDASPGGKLTSTSHHVNSLIGKFNQLEVEFWKQIVFAHFQFESWVFTKAVDHWLQRGANRSQHINIVFSFA